MIEIAQFKNKIKTHGLFLTLFYTAQYVARPVWRKLCVEPILKSYSQRYEDVIVDKLLGNKDTGTYLDIGAYDPNRLSNTKRFYDRGWRGCNVEPNPRHFKSFVRDRSRDLNLNVGISDAAGRLVFFEAVPDALSTFSEERAKELRQMGAKIRREIEIPVITMKDLVKDHLDNGSIDFCTIDTEGMDLKILKSNDWERFRPRVLCIEVSITQGTAEPEAESVEGFLASVGYKKHTQTIDFGVPLNEIYISAT